MHTNQGVTNMSGIVGMQYTPGGVDKSPNLEDLKKPSSGNSSTGEPEKEAALAPIKKGERISGEGADIFTVYVEGQGANEKKKELSSHTFLDEAKVAAHKAGTGGKDGKIEVRPVIKLDDGRYINGERKVIRIGLDKQIIAKLRDETLKSLPEALQIALLKFNESGEYIATPSES